MPNIRSAKKRVKITKTKTDRNNSIKTSYKTAIKNFEKSLENNDKDVKEKYSIAVSKIDKAQAKGIIKKNTAARKKSTLSKMLKETEA